MAMTIAELKEKLARAQQELAEVSAALDEVAAVKAEPSIQRTPSGAVRFTGPGWSDPATLRALADEAFRKMGFDDSAPILTPKEVQDLMLREGVRPEDRIFTRTLYEMREE
jgi:hypothetical protein